ncbi:MAG TPA: hypothetical protein PLC98_09350 [Anaerolineales bacterium]|nr:hypothetical protein [Anaerolineales bacterium]
MKPRRVALRARVGPAIDLALLGLATGAFWTGYGQATVDLHVAFGWAMTTGVAAHLALHRASVTGLLAGWLRPMTAAQRWRAIFNSGFLATFAVLVLSGLISDQIYAPAVARVHGATAWIFVGLAALHLILNARWIGAQVRRLIGRRESPGSAPARPAGTGVTSK